MSEPREVLDWERVKALFLELRELAPETAATRLDELAAESSELADEVRSLLQADGALPGFLHGTAEEALGAFLRPDPDLLHPGQEVGRYVLECRIGTGGMGSVWKAHLRDDPERVFALKFIRRGLDTAIMLRRFAQEQRTLALLNHPNVAALVDAGVTADDRPYLVMEYIEGASLVEWCDERRLGVRDRLRLFVQVCEAVHFMHRSLVVHRDLKPSNVLVTRDGVPKLLDFGVAKMFSAEGGATAPTELGPGLLTPRYASPEQLRGLPVSTSSDVYSLGVVLFELLTGRRPFPRREGSFEEARQGALDPPPRPSQVVTEAAAELRGTKRDLLRRQLRGDLDTIVQTALRIEPERRYASAGHFAEDLERHLQGQPVVARGDSLGYLTAKWARRNAHLVVAALLVLLTVAGAFVGIARQARIAREEADFARRQSDSLNQVVDLLVGLFESSDPGAGNPQDLRARDLVEHGAELLRGDLGGNEAVRATLLNALGRVFLNLGLPDRAERLLRDSLELRRRTYDEPHPQIAEALEPWGELLRARGRLAEAEEVLRDALRQWEATWGLDHLQASRAENALGLVLMEEGELGEAEQWFQRALEVRRRELGPDHPSTLVVQGNLASLLYQRRRWAEAEAALRSVLAAQRAVADGGDDLHTANTLNNLGLVLMEQGRLAEAEESFRKALDVRQRLLERGHPDLAATRNNLAVARYRAGDYSGAATAFHEAAAATAERLGDDHLATLLLQLNEARSLLRLGRTWEARSLLAQAWERARRSVPEGNAVRVDLLQALGLAYLAEERPRSAESVFERAVREYEAQDDADPVRLARLLLDLGQARVDLGDAGGAETAFRGAREQLVGAEVEVADELGARVADGLAQVEQLRAAGRSVGG